jgi:hypothetical protein
MNSEKPGARESRESRELTRMDLKIRGHSRDSRAKSISS